jgi:hypothetical protein
MSSMDYFQFSISGGMVGCRGNIQSLMNFSDECKPYCYTYMFENCTNLNYIKCLATDKSTTHTREWVMNINTTGTFIKHPDATWSTGKNGIPSGWTVVDAEL